MKVVVTDAAWTDILEIARTIQVDNPSRAPLFIDDLYERCHGLGDMPLANVLLPGYEESGIRRGIFGNYLIFYRVGETAVEVLHILHGAREYEKILFGEN